MNFQNIFDEEVMKAKEQKKLEEKLIFIKKRRECNARAQKIVELLLDTTTGDKFLEAVKYINQAHLEDVFEERFITCTCGYPLCDKKLEKIPKQRYKISTAANKVYDITERKKFCSPQCFSAAKFIRNQLPSSPLWVLEDENSRNYRLWSNNESTFLVGDEVNLKYEEVKKSEIDKSQKIRARNVQVKQVTQENVPETLKTCNNDVPIETRESSEITTNIVQSDRLNNLTDAMRDITLQSENEEKTSSSFGNNKEIQMPENMMEKGMDTMSNKMKTKEFAKPFKDELTSRQKNQCKISILEMVKHALQSWITIDSLVYLFGEQQVKTQCLEAGLTFDIHSNKQLTPKQMEQYAKICKKLDLIEIQDKQIDKSNESLKPLPDFESLKRENHELMVKVRAYYQGNTHIPTSELNGEDISESVGKNSEENTFLPLIDNHDQKIMRKNIMLSFLDPIISRFLIESKINETSSAELRKLVDTFELDAKNITFKPVLQKLIAIFILKLITMAHRNSTVQLNNFFSTNLFTHTLSAYNISETEFDKIITTVTSVKDVINAKNKSV